MAANLTRLPFIRGPCTMSIEKERTQDTLTDTFSFQHCLFTILNVVPTSQDCSANIVYKKWAVIVHTEIKLSKLKLYTDFCTILVVKYEIQ